MSDRLGAAWAACSTEGLLIYSLESASMFDPYQLEESITPDRVQDELNNARWFNALLMSLKLNDRALIRRVLEAIPGKEVKSIALSIPLTFVDKLLDFLAFELQSTIHLEW